MDDGPHPYPNEFYFEDEAEAREHGWPRWVDVHSVTCPLCGMLANETETIPVGPEHIESGLTEESRHTIEAIWREYGSGEVHMGCFTWARRNLR